MNMDKFRSIGLCPSTEKGKTFAQVFDLVKSPEALELARVMWIELTSFLREHKVQLRSFNFTPKAFLSSFLCLSENFLNEDKNDEAQLQVLAQTMLQTFDALVSKDCAGECDEEYLELAKKFWKEVSIFIPKFDNFQSGGNVCLLNQAAETFAELMTAKQGLKLSGLEHMEVVMTAIQSRINELQKFVQSLRVDVATFEPLSDAVRSNLMGLMAVVTKRERAAHKDAPKEGERSERESSSEDEFVISDEDSDREVDLAQELAKKRQLARMVHDSACNVSPQQQTTGPQFRSMISCPQISREFVHSLGSSQPPDTAYVVPPFPHTFGIEDDTRIRTVAEKALFDLILRDISQNPPDYGRLKMVTDDIRDRLMELCGRDIARSNELKNELDWEELKLNIDMPTLMRFVNFVCSHIAELSSSVAKGPLKRETERCINDLQAVQDTPEKIPQAIVSSLAFVSRNLNNLRRETRKYKMLLLLPQLRTHSVQIEQQWIEAEFAAGGFSYDKNVSWLAEQMRASPHSSMEKILQDTIFQFVRQREICRMDKLPDCLIMDFCNITYLQQVIQCTVLLQCFVQLVPPVVKAPLDQNDVLLLRQAIITSFSSPNVSLQSLTTDISDVVQRICSTKNVIISEEQLQLLARMVGKTADTDDAVYKAFHTKFMDYIASLLEGKLDRVTPPKPFTFDEINFISASIYFMGRYCATCWQPTFDKLSGLGNQPVQDEEL